MSFGMFEYLESEGLEERKAQRKATIVAKKRVDEAMGKFLRQASTSDDFNARTSLVSKDFDRIVSAACDEYGVEYSVVAKAVLDEFYPEEVVAKTASMQVEARKPKMCPYHSEVTQISLAQGEPQAGFNAMSQHAWSDKHCQGEWDGKCNFKPEMTTQKYWDDKAEQAEERKREREEQREQELEQEPFEEVNVDLGEPVDSDFEVNDPVSVEPEVVDEVQTEEVAPDPEVPAVTSRFHKARVVEAFEYQLGESPNPWPTDPAKVPGVCPNCGREELMGMPDGTVGCHFCQHMVSGPHAASVKVAEGEYHVVHPDNPEGTRYQLADEATHAALGNRFDGRRPVVHAPEGHLIYDPDNFWDGPTHVYPNGDGTYSFRHAYGNGVDVGPGEWETFDATGRGWPGQPPTWGSYTSKLADTGLGAPEPKMDKRKWTPQTVQKLKVDDANGPHPTKTVDIMEPIVPENRDKLTDIGEQVTKRVELDTADNLSSGFGTGGETHGKGGTFPKGTQANPVT